MKKWIKCWKKGYRPSESIRGSSFFRKGKRGMSRRLVLEALEEKRLLAADGLGLGSVVDGAGKDSVGGMTAPIFPGAADNGTVFLYGVGDAPTPGATGSDLEILFKTSRKIDGNLSAFSLFVPFEGDGLRTVSTSEFDPERAGFQLGNLSGDSIPDMAVSDLFPDNLIANGRYAVYLYSGGEGTSFQEDWFLKVTWFDLSLSGDWTSGAETVTDSIGLMSIHFNFDENLTHQTSMEIGFSAECDEGWSVDAEPFTILIPGEPSSDLIAEIAEGDVTIQSGCSFFLSGGDSYSMSGRKIAAWLWDLNGDGAADLEGKEVWIDANAVKSENGLGSVGLTVRDADGNVSSPTSVSVTKRGVAPVIRSVLTDYGDGRILKIALNYESAQGVPAAVWEIDWGDGSETETIESLSFSLTAAHCYEAAAQARTYCVTVRVTDEEGVSSGTVWVGNHVTAGRTAPASLPKICADQGAESAAANLLAVRVMTGERNEKAIAPEMIDALFTPDRNVLFRPSSLPMISDQADESDGDRNGQEAPTLFIPIQIDADSDEWNYFDDLFFR